jgi:ferredoxin
MKKYRVVLFVTIELLKLWLQLIEILKFFYYKFYFGYTKEERTMANNQKSMSQDNLPVWIENTIKEFCHNSPENSLRNKNNEPITDNPLVGFSNGADPLYDFLQKDIGPPQMTPHQIFEKTFPNAHASPKELTVISYILPTTQLTKEDNRKETIYPSERWALSKFYGNEFSKKLSTHLVKTLNIAGYEAVVPAYTTFYLVVGKSEKYGLASSWSERHAAYVSGLGTFGLCDGLITERGKAMRCYSIIAKIHIPPTPRPYTGHHAYCLYHAKGTCGACIKRCPAGAISPNGHDKERCRKHVLGAAREYVKSQFGIYEWACGLCQTGVPCESKNPVQFEH